MCDSDSESDYDDDVTSESSDDEGNSLETVLEYYGEDPKNFQQEILWMRYMAKYGFLDTYVSGNELREYIYDNIKILQENRNEFIDSQISLLRPL